MKTGRIWPYLLVALFIPLTTHDNGETYSGLAKSWNMIPSRSLAGPHYLYKDFELLEDMGMARVTGPVVQIINGQKWGSKIYPDGYTTELDLDDFENEQFLGQSVFEASTRLGTDVGTAFLVGRSLVMTNRHVLSYPPHTKKWECGHFGIKLNHRQEKIECEKVRYCSQVLDFCLVEMKKMANGAVIGSEVRPLRLTRKVHAGNDINLLHIGNVAGLGIQASRGQGLKLHRQEFYHFAPTLNGSSGAPILDEKQEVLGINWGNTSGNDIDETAFNRGILISAIFDELLKYDVATLKDVKSFRSWYYRTRDHRKVRIIAAEVKD